MRGRRERRARGIDSILGGMGVNVVQYRDIGSGLGADAGKSSRCREGREIQKREYMERREMGRNMEPKSRGDPSISYTVPVGGFFRGCEADSPRRVRDWSRL